MQSIASRHGHDCGEPPRTSCRCYTKLALLTRLSVTAPIAKTNVSSAIAGHHGCPKKHEVCTQGTIAHPDHHGKAKYHPTPLHGLTQTSPESHLEPPSLDLGPKPGRSQIWLSLDELPATEVTES
jgi:hypothetical protein